MVLKILLLIVLKAFLKKYFNEKGNVYFNHLQSDQYAMYIYMLSRYIHLNTDDTQIPTKLYYLNKALHSVDIYFRTELPSAFLFVHPLGSILGRAKFADYFVMYQNCTVGCLNEGVFPTFEGKVIMYSNSNVLGNCVIGDNVCVASGTSVINTNIPSNSIVLGEYPNYIIKENKKDFFNRPPFLYEEIL
jgi:serine O-acetyltransferase